MTYPADIAVTFVKKQSLSHREPRRAYLHPKEKAKKERYAKEKREKKAKSSIPPCTIKPPSAIRPAMADKKIELLLTSNL